MTISLDDLILKISESELELPAGLDRLNLGLYMYVERELTKSTDSASFLRDDLRGFGREKSRAGLDPKVHAVACPDHGNHTLGHDIWLV